MHVRYKKHVDNFKQKWRWQCSA